MRITSPSLKTGATAALLCSGLLLPVATATQPPPSILLIVIDDVGIDQMQAFGYWGLTPPAMSNIEEIAGAGVGFRNHLSMPACSPSRAVLFEGRFPFRSNLYGALGPADLLNSVVSSFDSTTSKLLKQSGYESVLFEKFHLALQGNNLDGPGMVHALGWDYFSG